MPTESRSGDPRLTAVIVASAMFMQNLDSTVVATALPAMARDFGEPPLRMGVVITSYLVALTVFIPVSGWIADRFGARRVFMGAIAVFTLASALCGRADSLEGLVAARVLQGLGGAMMVPVGRLLMLRRVRKEELLTAMTWLTMPAMLGPVLGPPLGGFLTDAISWRAVFDINVPVGVLGLALVALFIPPVRAERPAPLDLTGLALTGVALAGVMFGVETWGRGIVPPGVAEAGVLLGLVAGALAWRHCRRVANPAVDLGLLRLPTLRAPVVAGTLFRMGTGGTPFLVALTLQVGFGRSASESGLVAFATAIGAFAMKPVARPVLRRFGFRATLAWNGVLAALATAAGALFAPSWPLAAVFAVLLVGGLVRSLQFTAYNTLAYADVPPARMSAATSLYGTVQQLSAALGIALASAALQASVALAGRTQAATADFSVGFLVAGLVALTSVPLVLRLPPDAGAQVSGHARLPPPPPRN
jgi:EmrB/QacA subfamily drug resistance transporter